MLKSEIDKNLDFIEQLRKSQAHPLFYLLDASSFLNKTWNMRILTEKIRGVENKFLILRERNSNFQVSGIIFINRSLWPFLTLKMPLSAYIIYLIYPRCILGITLYT